MGFVVVHGALNTPFPSPSTPLSDLLTGLASFTLLDPFSPQLWRRGPFSSLTQHETLSDRHLLLLWRLATKNLF